MDKPSDDPKMAERLAWFGREPEGVADFQVYHPASCASDKTASEAFTLRLADFETSVIGEILQVSLPERNALLDCVEYLQQKARTKVSTNEPQDLEVLLDASPQARVAFTLRTLRERAPDRSPRGTEFFPYPALTPTLNCPPHS